MLRLRERFRGEGSVISYPARSLGLPNRVASQVVPDEIAGTAAVAEGPSSGGSGAYQPQRSEFRIH